MRGLVAFIATTTAGLIAFSYMGSLHAAGDSFAVFRFLMVGVLLVCGLLCHRYRLARIAVLVCLALIAQRLWVGREGAQVAQPDHVIYQKNMLFHDYDEAALMRDIRESGARVVTLQEVSTAHYDFLDIMKDTHPYQVVCTGTVVGAVAILSSDPVVGQFCSQPTGIAVADIAVDGRDAVMRVASLHLHWPWPHSQAASLDVILPQVTELEINGGLAPQKVILGGDFNMVPWGHAMRRVEEAFGVVRIGAVERTFEVFGYPLTIDHVMAGPNATGTTVVRPQLGSDHFGVVGRIVFNAP